MKSKAGVHGVYFVANNYVQYINFNVYIHKCISKETMVSQ